MLSPDYQYLIDMMRANNPGMSAQFDSYNGDDAQQMRVLGQYNLGMSGQGYVADANNVTDSNQRLFDANNAYSPYGGKGTGYVQPTLAQNGVVQDQNSAGGFSFGQTMPTPGSTAPPAVDTSQAMNTLANQLNQQHNTGAGGVLSTGVLPTTDKSAVQATPYTGYTGFGNSQFNTPPPTTTGAPATTTNTGISPPSPTTTTGGGTGPLAPASGGAPMPGSYIAAPGSNGIYAGAPAGTKAPAGYYAGTVPGTSTTAAVKPPATPPLASTPVMPTLNSTTGSGFRYSNPFHYQES